MAVKLITVTVTVLFALANVAQAQGHDDTRLSAQRDAMRAVRSMDGLWRGPAWQLRPGGDKMQLTQTERVGPFLGGSVKVIEGRGYDSDGRLGYNAFGTITFDPSTRSYTFVSHAMGYSGQFPLTVTSDGFMWQVPAGPDAVIRYTATIKGDEWRETGERVVGSSAPVQVFEMNLKRIGDTDWPAAGFVTPK